MSKTSSSSAPWRHRSVTRHERRTGTDGLRAALDAPLHERPRRDLRVVRAAHQSPRRADRRHGRQHRPVQRHQDPIGVAHQAAALQRQAIPTRPPFPLRAVLRTRRASVHTAHPRYEGRPRTQQPRGAAIVTARDLTPEEYRLALAYRDARNAARQADMAANMLAGLIIDALGDDLGMVGARLAVAVVERDSTLELFVDLDLDLNNAEWLRRHDGAAMTPDTNGEPVS